MDCIAGMGLLPDGAADMILTDLPYGVTYCPWDTVLPLDQLWMQIWRVLKPNGAAVLTACQPFTTALIESSRRQFRYCWYWAKNQATGFCFAKYQPMRCVEDVLVFYRKMPTYNPQGLVELGEPKMKPGKRSENVYKEMSKAHLVRYANYPRSLLAFPCERGLHPTQKPAALFEYLVRTYTNPGDLVLDCCMGSGTTAVACVHSGRRYAGFEIDEGYWRTAVERVEREAMNCGHD